MRIFLGLLAVLGVAAVLFIAFGRSQPAVSGRPEPLQVSATIFPLADWLREVGGPDVAVHCLITGTTSAHEFEPTPNDAVTVSRSRALFAVGLGLDEWAERLVTNAGQGAELAFFETGGWIEPRKLSVVTAVEQHHGAGNGHHHAGGFDPHYWLDPQRARTVVLRLAVELGKLDPAHAQAYSTRAQAYAEKLSGLDAQVAEAARSIPPGAQIVTFHEAYGYLLERLHIKLAAVIQTSPGVEPALGDVTEAVRMMRQIGQRAVFREPEESARAAELVAKELNAKIEVLDPMDSEASSVGTTYLERLQHDILVLREAFARTPATGTRN